MSWVSLPELGTGMREQEMLPFSSAPWISPTALKGNCPKVAMWPPKVTHGYPQRAGARVEMCCCTMRNQTWEEDDCCCLLLADGVSALQLCSPKAGSYRALSQGCAHKQQPAYQAIQDSTEDAHPHIPGGQTLLELPAPSCLGCALREFFFTSC